MLRGWDCVGEVGEWLRRGEGELNEWVDGWIWRWVYLKLGRRIGRGFRGERGVDIINPETRLDQQTISEEQIPSTTAVIENIFPIVMSHHAESTYNLQSTYQ